MNFVFISRLAHDVVILSLYLNNLYRRYYVNQRKYCTSIKP